MKEKPAAHRCATTSTDGKSAIPPVNEPIQLTTAERELLGQHGLNDCEIAKVEQQLESRDLASVIMEHGLAWVEEFGKPLFNAHCLGRIAEQRGLYPVGSSVFGDAARKARHRGLTLPWVIYGGVTYHDLSFIGRSPADTEQRTEQLRAVRPEVIAALIVEVPPVEPGPDADVPIATQDQDGEGFDAE